jgi:hypothetical protein
MGVTQVLMVALLGITYGWQDDGSGGVEYIVQLSPAELQQIGRLGEVTSTIDPAVAGRVSRIKIQVGSGPLPRDMPLAKSSQEASPSAPGRVLGSDTLLATDRSPVPTPELTAMMKPADNAAAAPGFQFPTAVQDNIDQAGREIATRGQIMWDELQQKAAATFSTTPPATVGADRIAPPSTRVNDALPGTPAQQTMPMQQAMPGQQQLPMQPPMAAQQPVGNQQPPGFSGASAPVTLPPFTGSTFNGSAFNGSAFGGGTNNSVATTIPGGGPSTEPNQNRDQTWRDYAGPRVGGPTTDARGFESMQSRDPRATTAPPATTSVNPTSRSNTGTFGQPPAGMSFQNPDPRSAERGIPATHQPVNQFGNDQFQRHADTEPRQQPSLRGPEQTNFDRWGLDQGATDRTADARFAGQQSFPDPRDLNPPAFDPRAFDPRAFDPRAFDPRLADPRSIDSRSEHARAPDPRLSRAELAAGAWSIDDHGRLLDRQGRQLPDEEAVRVKTAPRNQIAAQPLFNGMLLFSFVANIYLLFWLKNLRLRFRDMVAAKRLSGAGPQPST